MAYSASNPPVMEQTTQDVTENLQSVNLELKRFLDERNNKLPRVSPNISAIHEKTDRVEKNQVAKEKEFYSKRGKFIPLFFVKSRLCQFLIHKVNPLNPPYNQYRYTVMVKIN